jgi:hypothetical protein
MYRPGPAPLSADIEQVIEWVHREITKIGTELSKREEMPTFRQDTVTASHTIAETYGFIVYVDTSSTDITITLPPPKDKRFLHIKKIAAANTMTITPNGGTIDGDALIVETVQYASYTLAANGTGWSII